MSRETDRRTDPNPDWQPTIGRLFVRTLSDVRRLDVSLCYAKAPGEHISILEMREWVTEPRTARWVEREPGTYHHTGAGGLVTRWEASDGDIAGLVRLIRGWSQVSWAENAAQERAHPCLAADEKQRLLRVAKMVASGEW